MNNLTIWWLFLNLATLAVMGFYSMIEFACVSFNKVRLQYYVSQGNKRALWLDSLLKNPSWLFGTTLIGVNVAMMISSECARQFYSSLGFLPEIAPLTQVLIAITIGELAPMLAARRYPEHVAMLGMPLLYASATIMKPALVGFDAIIKVVTWAFGHKGGRTSNIFISRDELQTILEGTEEPPNTNAEDFNVIVSHIFGLRDRTATQIMEPANPLHMIPPNSTVAHMKQILKKSNLHYLPIYHRSFSNIVGIAFARDLIKANDSDPVKNYSRPPWFITQDARVLTVLAQFRHNNQTLAIVLNKKGKAVGILTLNTMLQEVLGGVETKIARQQTTPSLLKNYRIIERTVSGDMSIEEFNREFEISTDEQEIETLSQLITQILGHIPESGESVLIGPLKLMVKETSLLGARTVVVTAKKV